MLSVPIEPETICLISALALAIVIFLLYVVPKIIKLMRGNVSGPTSPTSPLTGMVGSYVPSDEEESDEEGEEVSVRVGQTYPITGSFLAQVRVDKIDLDEKEIRCTLLIEVPAGSDIKLVQKGWDEYNEESFICVVYTQGRVWRTLTWAWNMVEWSEFDFDNPVVDEVEVSVAPL